MARLRIEIRCNNRTFRDPREPQPEVTSVLVRYIQAIVNSGRLDGVLYDVDGNPVGAAEFDAND
jgi:hypothetical protein